MLRTRAARTIQRTRLWSIVLCLLLTATGCLQSMQTEPDATESEGPVSVSPELAVAGMTEAELTELYNQAGCDGGAASCGNSGECCDRHDECIDRECPPGFGDVRNCTQADVDAGRCPQACQACHGTVMGCIAGCTFGFGDCGPSDCCDDPADPNDEDTCGDEQACYDRTQDPPELITDPCECDDRGIDLSPSPPRPEGHCCEDSGWGCCLGLGEVCGQGPGPGGGTCCDGLSCLIGVCAPSPES